MSGAPTRLAALLAAGLAAAGAGGRASAAPAPVRTYHNPILYADYSDPDVIRAGADYYLVASSFHFSPGLPVLKSKDLVHWKIVGHVLARLPFGPAYDMVPPYTLTDATSKPVTGQRYAGGVWAPSLRRHDGRFYVYWATPDEGIFMSTAADPAGPWSAPASVLAGPGYEDPCPFWDDDGKAWLVHSRVGAGPLVLHALSADGARVLDAGKTIVDDQADLPVLEGPKLYKRHGYYYIFAPIGGVSSGPQAVLRARRIDGPYEFRKVLLPGNGLAGPHQGGYVETPSGQGWFIHFNSSGAFGRIDYLEPVAWRDDWPLIGAAADGQADAQAGLPVNDYPCPDTGQVSSERLQDSDEFSAPALGLQWSWNHNPDDARWSLQERPGYLRIEATRARYLVGARNVLTQVLQGPASTITTRLELQGLGERQRAGLALFGVGVPWVGVVHEDGVDYLTYANRGEETRVARVAGKAVVLRAEVAADQSVQFAYAEDGSATFRDAGGPIRLASFSWWKGSRPALFTWIRADADQAKTGGGARPIVRDYVDVDWFRVAAPRPTSCAP